MKLFVLIAMMCVAIACNTTSSSSSQTLTNTDTAAKATDIEDTAKVQSNGYTTSLVEDSAKLAANKLIVPGKSIGDAVLNMNADSLETLFGKPDMSDAAMGKAWLTWYGKKPDEHNNKTQLNIYTSYKDTSMRERSVQQIRTTSSFFATDNGIHVYSSIADIKKAFPYANKIDQNPNDAKKFIVYDDVQQGIAFQMVSVNNSNICTGIFVHLKGKKVKDIYIDAPQ